MRRLAPLLSLALVAEPALACDKVGYAEAKGWSTAKIKLAYCADIQENTTGLLNELNGIARQDRATAARCTDQIRLYERILDERGITEYDLKGICAKS